VNAMGKPVVIAWVEWFQSDVSTHFMRFINLRLYAEAAGLLRFSIFFDLISPKRCEPVGLPTWDKVMPRSRGAYLAETGSVTNNLTKPRGT